MRAFVREAGVTMAMGGSPSFAIPVHLRVVVRGKRVVFLQCLPFSAGKARASRRINNHAHATGTAQPPPHPTDGLTSNPASRLQSHIAHSPFCLLLLLTLELILHRRTHTRINDEELHSRMHANPHEQPPATHNWAACFRRNAAMEVHGRQRIYLLFLFLNQLPWWPVCRHQFVDNTVAHAAHRSVEDVMTSSSSGLTAVLDGGNK